MPRVLNLHHRAEWTDSRVVDVLVSMGHEVEFRCPPAGDPVPTDAREFDAIVVGGSYKSTYQAADHPDVAAELALAKHAVDVGVPYLGLCYGAQALAAAHGGVVGDRSDGAAEFGFYPLHVVAPAAGDFFDGLTHVFEAHYSACLRLPEGAELLASTDLFEVQAFRIGTSAYGFQFHPDTRADMIPSWFEGNQHLLARGAEFGLERQMHDAEIHEAPTQQWLERFLAGWLPS